MISVIEFHFFAAARLKQYVYEPFGLVQRPFGPLPHLLHPRRGPTPLVLKARAPILLVLKVLGGPPYPPGGSRAS